VVESTVANSCIGHWHETGLQTFQCHPSSSHIVCWDLCFCIIIGSLVRVIDALKQVD
jgi:hypothetical protein